MNEFMSDQTETLLLFDQKEAQLKAKTELEQHQQQLGIKVREPAVRKPRMIVKDVSSDMNAEEFKIKICGKYNLGQESRVITKLPHKFLKSFCAFLIEVNENYFETLN